MILETINRLRKERGITIADLAEEIGMSPVTLQRNLSKGSKLRIGDLEAIIEVLGAEKFYSTMMLEFQRLEFQKMDVQGDTSWGVFLLNGEPYMAGYVSPELITIYRKEGEPLLDKPGKLTHLRRMKLTMANGLPRFDLSLG